MDDSNKPQINHHQFSPEEISYIYQALSEFEPFTTPETKVTVVAKDPLELLSNDDESEHGIDLTELPKKSKLKKMYRIAISLSEDGGHLHAEGLHENMFEAIRMAKDKLLSTLNDIQDEIISNSDRHLQIKHALAAGEDVH